MRGLVPRQSGSAAASSSDSASSAASGGTDTSVQTSGFTTATAVTTVVFSSQPSSTPFSADATTTPTTTRTTSTSQTTTSASPSATPTHVSSTPTPTSSSSTSSQTTTTSTSTTQESTSAPPSSTTPPPTSSSPLETQSTIISVYTTTQNGTPVVTTTAIPTTIPLVTVSSSSNRTAIIAGSAAGGTALLILLLSFAFFARRQRFKRLDFLDAITRKRKQTRTRESFLAGEDLDDANLARPPLRYVDYGSPWDGSTRALMMGREANSAPGTPGTPGSTMPSRWSETGSAFREDVWPPPNEGSRLMDPFTNRDDHDLDLSRIVDDVMGPSGNAPTVHFVDRSVSSMYRGSMIDSDGNGTHSRTMSSSSNAALLEAAGLSGPIIAPVRSSPLAQQGTTSHSAENTA